MTVLRMAPTVRKAQNRIGYNFQNPRYLWEALQAPGSIVESGEIQGAGTTYHSKGFRGFPDGNKRLAVLGDAVLRLAIVDEWYKGEAVRERLARIMADVGSNIKLVMVGRTSGLDALVNKHPRDYDATIAPGTIASTVEAIIGAVYLDSDMKCVMNVMQNIGLIPRLVRRTGKKIPVSESTPSVLKEKLDTTMKSSQELNKSLQSCSTIAQVKQRQGEKAQSQSPPERWSFQGIAMRMGPKTSECEWRRQMQRRGLDKALQSLNDSKARTEGKSMADGEDSHRTR